MKFFPPNGNFSTQISSMECNGLITAKNSTLKLKTGLVEDKKMTKNDKNASKLNKANTLQSRAVVKTTRLED